MNLRSAHRLCSYVTIGLMLFAADARGQIEGNPELDAQWSAVRAISAGEQVEVRLLKKGTVRGPLVSSTGTAVTVAVKGGQETTAARSDIREVKVKRGQLRKSAIGAAIGGASGVATAVILDGALTDGNGISGSYAVKFGLLGAGIGFIVSSFKPAYRTVYKVR